MLSPLPPSASSTDFKDVNCKGQLEPVEPDIVIFVEEGDGILEHVEATNNLRLIEHHVINLPLLKWSTRTAWAAATTTLTK